MYPSLPASFLACRPTPLISAPSGTLSSMCPTPGLMLYTTQCVNPPSRGASGSCITNTNDFAFGGASFHANSGEAFSPSLVYLLGISAPSWISALVSCMATILSETCFLRLRTCRPRCLNHPRMYLRGFLVHSHIVNEHDLRKLRGCIWTSWPLSAHRKVQQHIERMVVHPLRSRWQIRRLARRIKMIIDIEADLCRFPFHSIDVKLVPESARGQ